MQNKLLPLLPAHDGQSSRQTITCRYKCGNACFHNYPNKSSGEYFGDIVKTALSRRQLFQGGAVAALALGSSPLLSACDDASTTTNGIPTTTNKMPPVGTAYTPVKPNTEDSVVVPTGYEQATIIRWGDPVLPGAPDFNFEQQSAQAQEQQFGFNNDFAGLLEIEGQPHSWLLAVNHEYTTEPFLFHGYDAANPTEEEFRIALAAHGLSIVEVRGESTTGKLIPVLGSYNRRITGSTIFTVTGPAAGSDFMITTADPGGRSVFGTFNNCSGGITPWGTVLSGEENFNQYFAHAELITDKVTQDRLNRYGIKGGESDRKWERFDPRFDLTKEANEPHRFGWIVEVNPFDPQSTPIKHTALGRFKHEAANIYVAEDGTVVSYCGDDERFDYMYKFVSDKKIQPGNGATSVRHNMTILDEGTLYVAKLSGNSPTEEIDGTGKLPSDGAFNGSGQWVPLLKSGPDGYGQSFVEGMSAAEVAVFTRIAGDKVGATKMDRPEDFQANPRTGKVYVALTNNSQRGTEGKPGVDEANPRSNNKNGQILEISDDHAGTSFSWTLLLVCGDPAAADSYFGGFDKTQVSPISCPDNLAFDSYGNLWVATDGNALKANDGLFSVVLEGKNRGETKQFLTVPIGAETCGPIVTDERVIVCVQHPGEVDGHNADNPRSHWPDGGTSQPRPAVVAVWKPGGKIGIN